MSRPAAELVPGSAGTDPLLDVALSAVLLEAVAAGRRPGCVRIYRPPATVAFGRRDSFVPGFPEACRAAERHGFTPLIRAPGGRAAAYDEGCLVVEEIVADGSSLDGIQERFDSVARAQADALRSLGVDARVGAVPGEYCPGAFSVNARGETKLLGAAQRVIRGGWLLSTVVVISTAWRVRPVIEEVYRALNIEVDPATVGGVTEEAPEVGVSDVEQAMLAELTGRYELTPGRPSPDDLRKARARGGQHRPRGGA